MISKQSLVKALRDLKQAFENKEKSKILFKQLSRWVESYEEEKIKWGQVGDENNSSSEDKSFFSVPIELVKEEGLVFFSDGACRGNPGPGAWGVLGQNHRGAILFEKGGVEFNTTNNRMELLGAIEGLKMIMGHKQNKDQWVWFYSDSRYVVDGLNRWLSSWKKRGWKKADKKDPENIDLWQQLDSLRTVCPNLKCFWVKAHAGHPQNEYCDQIANRALDDIGVE